MKKFKIQNSKFKFIIFFMFGILISSLAFSDEVFAMLTVKANHGHIKIDLFYHGSEVTMSGEADSGNDLIVKISSPEGHPVLRKRGKMAGLLWMNMGELKFEHTPNLYFLHSTKDIAEILNQEEMDKYVIGYTALRRHIEINPVANEDEKRKWFNEFVKFKESSRMYSTSSGNISTNVKDGREQYFIKLNWPYQASPGDYLVTVFAVEDNRVVEKAEAKILIEQVNIVKILSNMAKNKGALYGIISIVVALAAGFGVGMVFRKSGGAH